MDCIVFGQAGARRHDERAWVDPARVTDPRAAIKAMLGALAKSGFVRRKVRVLSEARECRRRLAKGRARRAAMMRNWGPAGARSARVTRDRRPASARFGAAEAA